MKEQEILAAMRTFLEKTQTSLSGVMGSAPEALKAVFTNLKAECDGVLKAMPMTDSVPAALDLGNYFRYFEMSMNQLSECCSKLATSLSTATAQVTSLSSETLGFKTRLEKGELVEVLKVKDLTAAAELNGRKSARVAYELAGQRRLSLSSAGLPAAADALLELEEKDFAARKETAQKRTAELKEKGISLSSASATLQGMVWGTEAEYARDLGLAMDVLKLGKVERKAEPALGGGGGGGYTGAV